MVTTRAQKRKRDENDAPVADRVLKRRRTEHIRVVTWNMQGQGEGKVQKVRNLMGNKDIHVICLQECGNPDDLHTKLGDELEGWEPHARQWARSADGNPRASLATYVRGGTAAKSDIEAESSRHRPALRDRITFKGKSLDIYNIHAPSGRGNAQRPRYLSALIPIARRELRPFIVAGDFNQDPTVTSTDAGFRALGMVESAPSQATRPSSGAKYDYFIHTPEVEMTDTMVLDDGGLSDHRPVTGTMDLSD